MILNHRELKDSVDCMRPNHKRRKRRKKNQRKEGGKGRKKESAKKKKLLYFSGMSYESKEAKT